jgi:hypothetical protein
MLPSDLRNLTWAQIQTHLSEDLVRVHKAWSQCGPGTTREVAERSGISLLTLRPRTCELQKIGLVALIDKSGTEGIYKFQTEAEAAVTFSARATEPRHPPVAPAKRSKERMTVTLAARIMAQHRRRHRPTDSTQLQIFPT